MAVKRLKFTKGKCIGCQLCGQVCSALHDGQYAPAKARIGIESYYDRGELRYIEAFCILCGQCAKKCPAKAISVEEKLTLDTDACTGCGLCAEACPKKVIRLRDERPVLCDTCNGNPSCVKICPHGALQYV